MEDHLQLLERASKTPWAKHGKSICTVNHSSDGQPEVRDNIADFQNDSDAYAVVWWVNNAYRITDPVGHCLTAGDVAEGAERYDLFSSHDVLVLKGDSSDKSHPTYSIVGGETGEVFFSKMGREDAELIIWLLSRAENLVARANLALMSSDTDLALRDSDPTCEHELELKWTDIRCKNCRGWYRHE